jgi:Ca2+-binding RTX toxin-like protein
MTTSTLNRDAQLSTLANAAYLDNPSTTIGSWTRVGDPHPTASGFFAVTYHNAETNLMVVSIRGTNGTSDLKADSTFATGGWNQQFTDAAAYTRQVQDLIAKDARYQGATLLTTGHSLGGGISQIIGKMFGLDGSGYEAPGASSVTDNPQFAAVKAQYASDSSGTIGASFTNYRAEGTFISSVGTVLGNTQNMVNLTDAGAVGFASAALAIAGVSTGGLGGLVASALGVTGVNVDTHHSMDGMERTMYLAAGLEKAIGNGSVKMSTVSLSQATGQAWTGTGAEPQVTVFKDANNQVTAYIQKEGTGWKLSTPDQQTTISLTPAGIAGQAPICTVKEPNKDAYTCTLTEKDGDVTRNTDANRDGVVDQSSTLFDDGSKLTTTHSTNADGEAWTRQEFDANGNITEVQTAVYDSKKGFTEVDVYRNGELINHAEVQGQATQAQLDRALNIAEQVAKATSFAGAGKSDSGESFVDTLNILDAQQTAQLTAGVQTLSFADTKYSGSNVASTPVFSTLTDYATWLKGRGTSTNVNNDVVADPSLLGLQDGALTVALARQNPNPVNVMRALQSVVLAGGVLSESFKQSVADQLGTNTANVNTWVASGGAAITSFLVAMDNPSVTNVTSAAISMLNAGITFTPSLQQTFADKLGVTNGQFGQMLAYGGAGLAVASVLKDPTPQNIVGATQQVTGMLGKMQGSASLQDLSYNLGNATAVFSVYNFAKNPNKQTAVSAMLSVAMRMPSLAPYAVPLAAALTIGEMIIPGFTDKAVNALVHDIPGVAFDVTKNVIKVEVSLLKGTLNLAGSVVETVGGVVNSVGNVVANTVTSVVNTATNFVHKVFSWTPLVVNLADDPVHTTTLNANSPLFDLSGDGVKERAGWITADEGFLVRDLNGNGQIDGVNEMFSERTSTTASTAFGALAELDSNKDGVISNTDANWSTLKVWVDKNSDGTTQANELYTLAQLGISSIKLNPTKNFAYDNGNVIGDKSTFTYTDGRVGEIADAIFTTQDASITQNVAQTLITQDSTTVRLSNGQTMKVLDVHGKTLTAGSATEGINIVTSTGGNTVTAADDANGLVLMGETGDTLNAGKGHLVTLVSNGGAKLVGNTEDNLYVVSQTTDVVVEAVNAGVDTVRSSASYTLSTNLENLTLTGTTAINGTGNALNNTIAGNNANNVLDGGAGIDTLVGGIGNDTYVVDTTTDVIVENANEGSDTVQSTVTYSLVNIANVENLTLTGSTAINGTGNALANTLIGNSANNVLDGGAGNDILNGGVGIDTLRGGLGDDTYVVDSITDIIVENFSEGADTVQSSVSYVLGSNLEHLTLTGSTTINGTGNALNNVIVGNAANNVLDGGAGNDTLQGGCGDDVYVMDTIYDIALENSNEGIDTVLTSVACAVVPNQPNQMLAVVYGIRSGNISKASASMMEVVTAYTLGANIENLTLTGYDAINGAGNELNNVIIGNAANNVLSGGAGADTLSGGFGDDVYLVDAADLVIERANEGVDTVQSSDNFTLSANVENLILVGNAANGTGNYLNNILIGNTQNNVLDGGTGSDVMRGGMGNDTYVVDASSDVIIENVNEGIDTVRSSINYYWLGTNIENLNLTGASDIGGYGNELNNSIVGNIANNYLDGSLGNDTLDGGGGRDLLQGGKGADTYVFGRGSGKDTVCVGSGGGAGDQDVVSFLAGIAPEDIVVTRDFANLTLTISGTTDALVLCGWLKFDNSWNGRNLNFDNENFVSLVKFADGTVWDVAALIALSDKNGGTAGIDYLFGINDISNVLDGKAGNDNLRGGSGSDTYIFGRGYDIDYVEEYSTVVGEVDTVQLLPTIGLSDLAVCRMDADVYIIINGTLDMMILSNWGNSDAEKVEQLKFADGTVAMISDLVAQSDYLTGTSSADTLRGGIGDDVYVVDSSGDIVVENSNEGTDTVLSSVSYTLTANVESLYLFGDISGLNATGNELNNSIVGNDFANVLDGKAGNDFLDGQTGNDTYLFNRGSGQDTIVDIDATAGNTDVLSFGTGIATDQLWFKHVGNDLEVSIIGGAHKATIQNWYSGSQNQVEQIKVAGKTLLNTDVDKLVQAMASFSAPASGQTTLPTNYQTTLAPVIAANWH